VHTGRSRNDQILVATRLWLKEKLALLETHCRTIADVCLQRAAQPALPLPGYTHLQRAVVSSTAMWFAGFAEGFIDNAWRARQTATWVDANPLGTAAGYGVNLPLDRAHTTQALGFGRMQISPIYAQLSRGKFEMAVMEAIGSAMLDARRLAWDLSLFTTAEFNFVSLPSEYTTGSSIMPNKRNPDVVELLRASTRRLPPRVARSNNCCRCPPAISAICNSPKVHYSTASPMASPRWSCCRICSHACSGTKQPCARRSSRRCMPPTWPSNRLLPACRSAMPIAPRRRLLRKQGRGARPNRVSLRALRPARVAIFNWTCCNNVLPVWPLEQDGHLATSPP
jgi:hypothetical protein